MVIFHSYVSLPEGIDNEHMGGFMGDPQKLDGFLNGKSQTNMD